ncbi:MAG: M48 family metallopeptidase [Magnetococcales bacterium]|nr:M48 family metallopeptidase [Magnetococcales bacterium]
MTTSGWIILAVLLTSNALDWLARELNLRALPKEAPEEHADTPRQKQHDRRQAYIRARTRLHQGHGLCDHALLLGFWFAGGLPWLDGIVRAGTGDPLVAGLLYTGALIFAGQIIDLPFALYATFVLEARFGFNRTTGRTWALDRLKGVILTVILGGPLLTGVLFLFTRFGPGFWWIGWISVACFLLLVQFVAPIWLLPLFNRFSPLPEGELKTLLLEYARAVNFPVTEIVVMDGSRRSTKANAFFTGFGRFRRIVLFDTLVQGCAPLELRAVLAHEVGHWRQHHLLESLLLGILNLGLMFYLLSWCLTSPTLYQAFQVEAMSVHVGLVIFALLAAPVGMVISPWIKWRSRQNEYAADRFAVTTCHAGEALVDALKKLAQDHLAHPTPHPLYVFLNDAHPPLAARIASIRRAMGEFVST